MDRRNFIRISSVALLPILLKITDWGSVPSLFPIQVDSDHETGHLLRESMSFPYKKDMLTTKCVIVGGGVAGVAAAYQLKNADFLLFELGRQLGGTSSSGSYNEVEFGQGAHYDLAYPANWGEDVLKVLQETGVVQWNEQSQLFEFTDKQYVIPDARQEQCFQNGEVRADVLGESEEVDDFYEILEEFEGKLPLPTRLIEPEYQYLDQISFHDFLTQRMQLSDELDRRISYQMLDDWGGTTKQVSALAGLSYYVCRPYNLQKVELISPPEGNQYFIRKMMSKIPYQKVKTNHLVRSINKEEDAWLVEIVDVNNKEVLKVYSNEVIYTGKKHAFPYVCQEVKNPFENHVYAPWVVMNIVLPKQVLKLSKWQNDILTEDTSLLGFVNSQSQYQSNAEYDVLTTYFCLPPELRSKSLELANNPSKLVHQTIRLIEETIDQSFFDKVEKVYVKVMGHAMAIPTPGYITHNYSETNIDGLHFAGVDSGRLPVFFEAMDSGIVAAEKVLKRSVENSLSNNSSVQATLSDQ